MESIFCAVVLTHNKREINTISKFKNAAKRHRSLSQNLRPSCSFLLGGCATDPLWANSPQGLV